MQNVRDTEWRGAVTTPDLYRGQGRVFTSSDLEPPLPLHQLACDEMRWVSEGSRGRPTLPPTFTLDDLSPPLHRQFRFSPHRLTL